MSAFSRGTSTLFFALARSLLLLSKERAKGAIAAAFVPLLLPLSHVLRDH